MQTKRFAVTGSPVLHSKSPLIFNTVFKHQSVDAAYTRLAAASAKEAISLFRSLGLSGMNVTAPFKEEMIDLLDELAPEAAAIGSVNTVVQENGSLKGYNTDYLGAVNALKKQGLELQGRRCVVIGAGGAGRAAAYGLVKENARVTIVNRTYAKAAAAAEAFGCRAQRIENLDSQLQTADILVSCLSPSINLVQEGALRRGLVVLDANYKASMLPGMAQKRGCMVVKGEEWLIEQAGPAYRLFVGQDAPAGVMEGALAQAQAKKENVLLLNRMCGSREGGIGQRVAEKLGLRFLAVGSAIDKMALEKGILAETQEAAPRRPIDHAWVILLHAPGDHLNAITGIDLIAAGEKEVSLVEGHIYQELRSVFE